MGALLRRDFIISIPYYFLAAALIIAIYFTTGSTLFAYYWLLIGLVIGLYYYDKQSEINRYLVSLPLSRKQTILARYLFVLLSSVAFYLFFLAIDLLFQHVIYQWVQPFVRTEPMTGISFFTYLCGALIVLSISIPIYVKFSYYIALTINLLSLIFVPIFIIVGSFKLTENNVEWFYVIAGFLLKVFESQPILVILLTTIIVSLLSFQPSNSIFRKKDLS